MSVQVSAAQVKSLRDRTGAGINDCRQALIEAGGDEEKAIEIIRKKGLAKAAKKAGAIATEGRIVSYVHPNYRIGVLVEVNCQTDFTARSEEFASLCEEIAMHIAAANPLYLRREEVPESERQKQLEIFRGQIEEEEKATGKRKPEAAIAKILEGKMEKWYSEVCLEEQELVSRERKSVGAFVAELSGKVGEKIAIRRFVRYELGEGIETQKRDFAAEVAAQLHGG
ncbi:MAG: translation elongation factor Ts [Sandaracinaceae bacterium]|nr:translation elongation factor Ts [Sandaracinaceae bacterium]MDW8245435.1 translation elongation factor Ts [Sandaracinaceae bacterium]